jgi:hypothetical protein
MNYPSRGMQKLSRMQISLIPSLALGLEGGIGEQSRELL